MSSVTTAQLPKGLEGVVATTSGICYIDGDQGVLAYRGIDVHELADNSTFEETCYLLWSGRLPSRNELKEIRDRLAEERKARIRRLSTAAVGAEARCAHGRIAHGCIGTVVLRPGREEVTTTRPTSISRFV